MVACAQAQLEHTNAAASPFFHVCDTANVFGALRALAASIDAHLRVHTAVSIAIATGTRVKM